MQQLYGVPIFSVILVCRSFKGRELLLHDKHPRKIRFFFYIFLPATNNCVSETILLRCTKYSLEIELQKLSSPVPHGQSEQFSLKSIKKIYIPANILNPCQFITDPLKSSRSIIHMLKYLDNLTSHSKMNVICAR